VALEVETFVVDRAGDHLRPRREECLPRSLVVRILDTDGRAAVAEDARRQVDRLLRAAHDHDVVGAGDHAALLAQMFGEHATQQRESGGVGIVELRLARPTGDRLPPHRHGARIGNRRRVTEVDPFPFFLLSRRRLR